MTAPAPDAAEPRPRAAYLPDALLIAAYRQQASQHPLPSAREAARARLAMMGITDPENAP